MIIPYNSTEITWHLRNNVVPALTPSTIEAICYQCNLVNNGLMCLSDEIAEGTGITMADMLEDLHIQVDTEASPVYLFANSN